MNTAKKEPCMSEEAIHAGGMVYVPPTFCPRPAYASAYPAAFVVFTGRAEPNPFRTRRSIRPILSAVFFSGVVA